MFIQKRAIFFYQIDTETQPNNSRAERIVSDKQTKTKTQARAERTADRFQLRRALRVLCVDRRRFHIYSTPSAQALNVVGVYVSSKS